MDILSFYCHFGQMDSMVQMHQALVENAGLPDDLIVQKMGEALNRERKARGELEGKSGIDGQGNADLAIPSLVDENKNGNGAIVLRTKRQIHKRKNKKANKLDVNQLGNDDDDLDKEWRWRHAFELAIDRDHFDWTNWRRKPLNQQRINFILERLKFVVQLGDDPNKIILRDDVRIRDKYAVRHDGEEDNRHQKLVLKRNPGLEFVCREQWFDTLKKIVEEEGHLKNKMELYQFVKKRYANITPKIVRTFLRIRKELLAEN